MQCTISIYVLELDVSYKCNTQWFLLFQPSSIPASSCTQSQKFAAAYLSCLWAKAGLHPGQVANSRQGLVFA